MAALLVSGTWVPVVASASVYACADSVPVGRVKLRTRRYSWSLFNLREPMPRRSGHSTVIGPRSQADYGLFMRDAPDLADHGGMIQTNV